MEQLSVTIPDANDLLLSGGKAPEPLKLTQVGYFYGGPVISKPKGYHVREYDPRNPGSGAPKFYDNGEPVWGVFVDLDITGLGVRRLYIDKPRMMGAVKDAMRQAGVHGLELSGYLAVAWTGEEASQGAQPAKTYAATYTAPGVAALAPQPPAVPAQRQYAPQPSGLPAQTLSAYQAAGYTPQQAQAIAAPPAYVPPPQAYAPVPETASQATVHVNPVPQAAPPTVPVITQAVAAAMQNAGISTEGYTVIPG